MSQILVIDGNSEPPRLLIANLKGAGHQVNRTTNGIQGEALALQMVPDLIILDPVLPEVDGFTLCQRLRRDPRTTKVPIMMLTALNDLEDRVKGFDAGADHYLAKPFVMEELLARVQALLRRNPITAQSTQPAEILSYGPLTILPTKREARLFDRTVIFTQLEFKILYCLLQHREQIVSPLELFKQVWEYDPTEDNCGLFDDTELIRVHIRNIRIKLEPEPRKPRYIRTFYKEGYRLAMPEALKCTLSC